LNSVSDTSDKLDKGNQTSVMDQINQSIIVVDAAVIDHEHTLIIRPWVHLRQLHKEDKKYNCVTTMRRLTTSSAMKSKKLNESNDTRTTFAAIYPFLVMAATRE
jgi:hypothetical protein